MKRGCIIVSAGGLLLAAALGTLFENRVFTGRFTAAEIVAGAAILLLYWGFVHLEQSADRTLLQKIGQLGLYVLLLLIALVLLEQYSGTRTWDAAGAGDAPGIVWYLVFAAAVYVTVRMLIFIQGLIFVDQSRRTSGMFYLLTVVMVLRIVQTFFTLESGPESGGFGWDREFDFSNATGVLTVLFLLLAVLNGFRCKWIHYLNRRQKIAILFAGTAVNIIAGIAGGSLAGTVTRFSITAGIFIRDTHTFFMIYSGLGLAGILLQLPSAGIMDRRMRQIRYLQNLGAELGSIIEKGELLSTSCVLAANIVNADVTWIELKAGAGYRLAWSAGLSCQYMEELPADMKADLRELIDAANPSLLINNVPRDTVCRRMAAGMVKAGSVLAAPLTFKETLRGYIYAVNHDRFGFSEENRGLFRAFADQVGVALENARLAQVSIEQEVYREELKLAHNAQMRLLPQKMPAIAGIELDAFCITANEIGGDFYDIIQVGPERTDIVIGDVSGKGASAAFYMAEMKGLVQALARHHACPVEILTEINGFVKTHFEKDTFVTMIYSMLYHRERKLVLARAGHPPVALVRRDKAEWLEPAGIGLGLATNDIMTRILKKQELSLVEGDTIVYLTDGLIEARNRDGEEFGEDRLKHILLDMDDLPAADASGLIRGHMQAFIGDVPQHDDVTLFILRLPADAPNNKERD
ncbi:SpoIIE family protein phosphatase [bacterium]|nr:SpoIIE family protein phosphatase [bacterium]